jgi:multiple sugar transport system substrate-binding protein
MRNKPANTLMVWIMCLASALLAGCGAASAPAAPPRATPAPQITLTYAFPDDPANTRAAAELIRAYTAANPGVQIASQPLPATDYASQLLARLGAAAPDLFVAADSQAPALIKRNAALDLRQAFAGSASLRLDDFQPAALDVWRRGDALYGLPTDITPQVLFYNQDLFDAAGVAYPANGWTWDDWLAKAQRLTARSGGQVTTYGTALSQWSPMVWGNGGELLDPAGKRTLLDRPEATAGVQFAADMVNVHKVAPPPKDAGGPDAVQLFGDGKVAMLPGASALAGTLLAAKPAFKWAIAPLPTGKVAASPLSISGLLVNAQTQQQPAALGFAAWVAGPQGNAVKAGILPYAAPALRSAAARPAGVSGADAIIAALQHGRTLPQVEAWPKIKTLVDQALKPVWQGQTTAEAVYKQVAPNINALLTAG